MRQPALEQLFSVVVSSPPQFHCNPKQPVRRTLSAPFTRHVMAPVGPEAPLELRQFVGPVKTDSRGR